MDPYMSILFMLTISFPEAMLMAYFAIQFMGGKPKLPEIVLIGLIQSVVAFIVRTLPIPIGLHTILLILSIATLIFVISRMPLWASLIGVIIGIAFYLLQEIFTGQIMLNISGMTMHDVVNHPYMRIIFFFPSVVVMLGVITLCKKYQINFGRIANWQSLREKDSIIMHDRVPGFSIHKEYLPAVIFIFLPVLLLFVLNFTYVSVNLEDYSGHYSNFFKALINGLIIILAFVSVWALRRINRSIEKEYEVKKAAETIAQLKELILSIRKQRHDFNHNLQTVYGLIEIGNYEGAREYIQNTYHYVSGTGELIKTDNPAISALLYSKIANVEARNIRFDIGIECSLEEFPLNGNQASSLLGNLIDNAVDVVDKKEGEDRAMRLNITAERGEYIIEVANKGEITPHLASMIFTPNFTTKEGHAGLGLAIVKEIVDKYKGGTQVFSLAGETVFKLTIPFRR